jgi:tetratricopeptide (TPR) repeat protein
MPTNSCNFYRSLRMGSMAAGIGLVSASLHGQSAACPAVSSQSANPAATAYRDGNYAEAEQLYTQALAQQPQNPDLTARLVDSLLHQGKVRQASQQADAALPGAPHSAALLTAQAEVQLREGQPWQAMQTLDAAAAADHCFARVHLIRSRALRIDSMYASERAEIERAHEIDPNDPDITQAWSSIVSAAQEVEGTEQSLASMKDLDAPIKQRAEASVQELLPLLSENSRTCKVLPTAPSADLSLLPSKQDGKHLDGYLLEAQLSKSMVKLKLDTAASGIFITRALAEANGLQQNANDPAGTVRAESVRVGPLEFHNCMLGVSDAPFADKGDGFISTDIFAQYLITIDAREQKLSLNPLPAEAGTLPGDRANLPEFAGYQPVYHRRQYLLVPVELNDKTRGLFALDTGMRMSAMTIEAARAVSNIKVNFTNPLQTASGPPAQVYRDSFDFQFANLSMKHQNRVLEFDPSTIEHNAGFEVAGLLGFDILHLLTMHLDYRDGLVKFESTNAETAPPAEKGTMMAAAPAGPASEPAAGENCPQLPDADLSIKATLDARVQGTLDSAHLKPGKEIWVSVLQGYALPECTLNQDATLYGHVTAVSSSKNPDEAQLAVVFDHADCVNHPRQPLSLELIGLVGPPGAASGLHEVIPSEVAGGVRSVSDTIAATNGYDPSLGVDNLPKTVRPGLIVDIPKLTLDPEGGPGCSSKISSKSRSVELATSARLIFLVPGPPALK